MPPKPTTAYPTFFIEAIDALPRALIGLSAFPVRAALRLSFYRGMLQSAQFLDVLDDLQHRLHDVVHVFFRSQEEVMREPDSLVIGGPFGGGTLVHVAQVEWLGPAPA